MIALVLGLVTPAVGADCASPLSTRELEILLDDARRSLQRLDSEGFRRATDRLTLEIPCLDEPISRHLAAEVHRTRGIRAVGDRDDGASRIFAAARSIEPAYKIPSSLIPEGHPVRLAYGAFDLRSGGFVALSPPAEGSLQFDGRESVHRPTGWPAIAQYIGGDGAVRWTAYLDPSAEIPEYPKRIEGDVVPTVSSPPLPPPAPVPVTPAKQRGARAPLLAASAGGAAVTAVLYGLAGLAEARFNDPATPDDQLDATRRRANSLVITSGFVGAASVGVGIAGFASR